MNKNKGTSCFVKSEMYKNKFEELLNNRKFMLLIVCNQIVLRINRIESLYKSYMSLRDDYCVDNKQDLSMYSEDFLLAEEIIYHIRKVVDEMIYSLWIERVGITNIDETQNKSIDSIGKYLNQRDRILTEFDNYIEFFKDLNSLSNSYKHSLCTFSPIKTDLNENNPAFLSYAIREKDLDARLFQRELCRQYTRCLDNF